MELQFQHRNQTFAFFIPRFFKKAIVEFGPVLTEKIYNSSMSMISDDYDVNFDYVKIYFGSFIYEPMNDFILRCHQYGLSEHFKSTMFIDPKIFKYDSRKTLTMYMLSAGFYLWLITVAVACVVFFLELVYQKVRHSAIRIIVEYILESFFMLQIV